MTARVKVLEYLGLMLNYMEKGKVRICMFKYIKKLKDSLSDVMGA